MNGSSSGRVLLRAVEIMNIQAPKQSPTFRGQHQIGQKMRTLRLIFVVLVLFTHKINVALNVDSDGLENSWSDGAIILHWIETYKKHIIIIRERERGTFPSYNEVNCKW